MMDNQCTNIFSTHATIYGSHSVKFAFIKRENIFFVCILNSVFKFVLCFFYFPHLLNFFPKLVLFFLFFIGGEKFFLTFVVLKESCCSSQREFPLFSIELDSFVFFILYFLLIFVTYVSVCSMFELSLSIHDKKGGIQINMWESCLFCLGGDTMMYLYVFLVSHCLLIYIYELFMIYVFILCYVKSGIYFLFTCIFHICIYAFVECFKKYAS